MGHSSLYVASRQVALNFSCIGGLVLSEQYCGSRADRAFVLFIQNV